MTKNTIYSEHVSVYPGMYERTWSEKELIDELHKTGVKVRTPLVHMQQFPDHYRIEMPIPGYEKESFFIHTNGRVLSIAGMSKKHPDERTTDHSAGKLQCECIIRNVVLPADADTDFVTAEYNNGILRIYLSTSGTPIENGSRDIIVY